MKKTILVDAWNTLVTKDGIFKELQNLLEEFPNRKIIVTNANEEERVKYGIVNMPYEVFSLAHKPDKTDPEFFKKLLKHFSLTSDQVVYFEHNPEAVRSAQSIGIKAFNYNKDTRDLMNVRTFLKSSL